MNAIRLAVYCLLLGQSSLPGAPPPNIVVFLVDDMGWGDLGCYGNEIIQSPHLDKFATEGIRFTQCYSACGVCSPSRSSVGAGVPADCSFTSEDNTAFKAFAS